MLMNKYGIQYQRVWFVKYWHFCFTSGFAKYLHFYFTSVFVLYSMDSFSLIPGLRTFKPHARHATTQSIVNSEPFILHCMFAFWYLTCFCFLGPEEAAWWPWDSNSQPPKQQPNTLTNELPWPHHSRWILHLVFHHNCFVSLIWQQFATDYSLWCDLIQSYY